MREHLFRWEFLSRSAIRYGIIKNGINFFMMNDKKKNSGASSKAKKPVILIVMDGWGVAPAWGGNAVAIAKTPNVDLFMKEYPGTLLEASGQYVGLPGRSRGNSEVGHLNLGAGKIVHQDLPRISAQIQNQSFFENPSLKKAIDHVKKNGSVLHLMGLLSDAGTHSHIEHLFALLDMARQYKVEKVYVHVFTDGRDTEPKVARKYIEKLENKMRETGAGEIASITGRYYAMDRDSHWDRIKKAYDAFVSGEAPVFDSAFEAVETAYRKKMTDEFIEPSLIRNKKKEVVLIQNGDSVIFFNFRPDRARQMTKAFVVDDDGLFERKRLKDLIFVTFVLYEEALPVLVAFEPENVDHPLGRVLSIEGKTQFHIAETEKYAHVTYFFNGGKETPFEGEDRILIPSPRVATYDLEPEMSAREITDELLKTIRKKEHDFYIVNYANADMVGHTGNIKAAIKACETVDEQVGRVVKEILDLDGCAVITADHGNAEQMINPITGEGDTEHTTNPVPFILVGNGLKKIEIRQKFGILGDVSPTILDIMGIKKPESMKQNSLIIHPVK